MAVIPPSPIRARERSTVSLTSEEFRYLEDAPDFWVLAEFGIVSLERTAKKRYGLKASAHVGQATVNGRLLVVEEKVEGALQELLELATHIDARVVEAPGFSVRYGRFLERLAERFLDYLGGYLLRGRRRRYVSTELVGSLSRGKTDLARTMRLWAKGRMDQLAYTADELSTDLLENRLIGLALYSMDRTLTAVDRTAVLLARARTMAILFEDVGWASISTWPLSRIAALFERALRRPDLPHLHDLLSLARLFALHFGIGLGANAQSIPVSWFVNLETLFEDAVREAIAHAAKVVLPRYSFSDWQIAQNFVVKGPQTYQAEPDVVGVGGVSIVMDTKYKELVEKPSSDDVYQLIAHMSAYDAKTGVLVYPSAEYQLSLLGETKSGQRIYVGLVSLQRLREDARRLLTELSTMVPMQ